MALQEVWGKQTATMRRCQAACQLRRLVVASVKIWPPMQGNRNDQTARGAGSSSQSLASIAARTGVSAKPLPCLNFRMIARKVSLYKHQARVLSLTGAINQHWPCFPVVDHVAGVCHIARISDLILVQALTSSSRTGLSIPQKHRTARIGAAE